MVEAVCERRTNPGLALALGAWTEDRKSQGTPRDHLHPQKLHAPLKENISVPPEKIVQP